MPIHSNHPYHLVEQSPWPIIASMNALFMMSGLTKLFYELNQNLFIWGLMLMILTSMQWWRDISREASIQGLHTIKVIHGLRWGMVLFIVSEICFFFSFFWAFFHSSLNTTMEIGATWPPTAVKPFNPFQIPLLNTAILLASGVTVTWSHHAMSENNHYQAVKSLTMTVTLGVYFTLLQFMEYMEASFSMSESVYGSTFFVTTGFHGLHVIIGSTFLLVCLIRLTKGHFSSSHHTGYEAAIWYWHFVDVVWLFLFIFIYWWGS